MEHTHLESLFPEISRFAEIEQIINFVKTGTSGQIVTMPGVGRGNICRFLAYNRNVRIKHLGKNQVLFHFVFINFTEIHKRQLPDVITFIFLQLTTSLKERLFEDEFITVDKIFKEALLYKNELVLAEALKNALDFLVYEKNLTITFLFERFELYIPSVNEDFFIFLQSLRARIKYKFSVIFSTTRPLEETIDANILSSFFEFIAGHIIYPVLFDKEIINFRINHLEELTKKKIDKKTIDLLLKLTGGHEKLTRLGIEAIYSADVNKNYSSDSLTELLLSASTIKKSLENIWNYLSPNEQILIVNKDNFGVDTSFLEKIGLLQDNNCAIPLLVDFAKKQKPESLQEKTEFSYEIATNSIKKNNFIISDKLTGSELRLLKFLIENPARIIERDEIINAVWKDTTTIIGVTDQALDQLIFRLRKKIEDNPNEPKYIQTVKGRGIKFIA